MAPTLARLEDRLGPATRLVSPSLTVFHTRTGILTPVQRLTLQGVSRFSYDCDDETYAQLARQAGGFEPVTDEADLRVESEAFTAGAVIESLPSRIIADIELLTSAGRLDDHRSDAQTLIGPASSLLRHPGSRIEPGCILNTEDGPIVIEEGARISRMSYIAGPAYVGPHARIDSAHILSSVIGRHGRIGGEVEESIFNDFSNKHHEGFVGHSIVGQWVNLGALTTTSDLKNNYGEVRLSVDGERVSTGTIKFGSIIGEFAKTAIGTLLNTGSVIEAGATVFGGSPGKHTPAFAWGADGSERYALERFFTDADAIAARRGETLSPERKAVLAWLWTCGAP